MTHNPIRPWRNIDRRKSRRIMVGNVPVGGDAPITVQTMTNTDTSDVAATPEHELETLVNEERADSGTEDLLALGERRE